MSYRQNHNVYLLLHDWSTSAALRLRGMHDFYAVAVNRSVLFNVITNNYYDLRVQFSVV